MELTTFGEQLSQNAFKVIDLLFVVIEMARDADEATPFEVDNRNFNSTDFKQSLMEQSRIT